MALSPTSSHGGTAAATASDGWVDDTSEAWTFATATTFTVPTDLTTKYTPGTRIKLTQATVKYFVVASSAFGAQTTVTITGGSDYTLANAAISANYHSYSVNPQGWPGWFNWTPGWTGFSANPTVAEARFAVVNRTLFLKYSESGTGTSNAVTFTITGLPIAAASAALDLIVCRVSDAGTVQTVVGRATPSGTVLTLGKTFSAAGGFTASSTKGAWINGSYEI